jgi:WD40 repeat protein
LDRSFEEPIAELKGHLERLYCIKYHPYVKNLLASASYDRTVKLWDIETQQAVKTLTGHENVVYKIF